MDSDEFKTQYCLSPETRVLTSNLQWIRIDSIKQGDKLVGFEEKLKQRYHQRRFCNSVVEDMKRIKRPCFSLTFEDGTKIISSTEHQWLAFRAGGRTEWITTEKLKLSDRIYKVCDVWNEQKDDYKLGYLSAAFDGEGSISQSTGFIRQLQFAQNDNVMLKKVKQYLNELNFSYSERKNCDCICLTILNGKYDMLRFLGTIRPERLLNNFDPDKLGTLRSCKQKERNFVHPRLINKEYLGEQEVIAIRTSSRTFIAEGLASHNCLKWVLERGQFITFENLMKLQAEFPVNKQARFYAGIDWGKIHDATILTIIDEDCNIVAWHEWQGDSYATQIAEIVEIIKQYKNLQIIFCDSTGNQDMAVNILTEKVSGHGVRIEGVNFNPVTKDEMYKNLSRLMHDTILGGFVVQPAPLKMPVAETLQKAKFVKQMLDLQKEIKNEKWRCNHPQGPQYHDDFCDSIALACLAFSPGRESSYEPSIY